MCIYCILTIWYKLQKLFRERVGDHSINPYVSGQSRAQHILLVIHYLFLSSTVVHLEAIAFLCEGISMLAPSAHETKKCFGVGGQRQRGIYGWTQISMLLSVYQKYAKFAVSSETVFSYCIESPHLFPFLSVRSYIQVQTPQKGVYRDQKWCNW